MNDTYTLKRARDLQPEDNVYLADTRDGAMEGAQNGPYNIVRQERDGSYRIIAFVHANYVEMPVIRAVSESHWFLTVKTEFDDGDIPL